MKKILLYTLIALLSIFIIACDRDYDFGGSNIQAINTLEILNITKNNATVSAKLNTLNGSTLSQRGVCYGIAKNPTTANSKVIDNTGGDIGNFSVNLTNLTAGTTYYARAFATTFEGTAYGEELSFTTLKPTLSTITTNSASSITGTTAYAGGTISDNGGAPVTERGVVFSSVNTLPTISDNKVSSGSGTGNYSLQLTQLISGQQYYVRAYAITTAGISYGNVISFKTLSVPQNVLTTDAVVNTANFSATLYGSIGSDGGSTITSRGFVYSSTNNTPILGSAQSFSVSGGTTGTFSGTLTSLQPGITYYGRAYATNANGTAYGNIKTFKIDLAIGQSYGGGKIAYILQSGDVGYIAGEQHGFIIPASLPTSSYQWGCSSTSVSTSTGFGSGESNTNNIANYCGSSSAGGAVYYLSSGGFSDWYLPSIMELLKIMPNSNTLSIPSGYYWSSSQYSSTTAYRVSNTSAYDGYAKTNSLKVIPIRKF